MAFKCQVAGTNCTLTAQTLFKTYFFIRSDDGLKLETSAFQIFHGGYLTFINSFDKINFCFNLPPTQHHSFFRN